MIKALKRKFVIIVMAALTAVIAVTIAIVNIVNFARVDAESDAVIEVLEENGGEFPIFFPTAPDGGGLTVETPYRARYYTALLDTEGRVFSLNMKRIASLSIADARAYVEHLYAKGKTSGMYKDFKYTAVDYARFTMYILLDCSADLDTCRGFLLWSSIIGLSGLVAVFVLVVALSGIVLKPAEESYKKQKRFITDAGHDIKTPLTVIGAEADIIDMEYGENEYTAEIKKQIEKLSSLTDKLIFLSRMEEDENAKFEEFDISALTSNAVMPFVKAAEAKGLTVSVDIEDGVRRKGNADNLERALTLVADNAVKYCSPEGNINVSLRRADRSKVVISFSNAADSVAPGRHDEFFDRFYRADGSRSGGGHGIGLSVVKAVVEAHKGRVTAFSDGNRVTVEICL